MGEEVEDGFEVDKLVYKGNGMLVIKDYCFEF